MADSITLVGRLVVTAVFATSAIGKLRDRAQFRASVALLVPAPRRFLTPIAVVTVLLEAALAAAAWIPGSTARTGVFATATVLLAAFTAVLLRAIRQGLTTPCACFGASRTPVGRRHVVRNVGLLATTTGGLIAGATGAASGTDYPAPLAWPTAILAATLITALALSTDLLAEVFVSR